MDCLYQQMILSMTMTADESARRKRPFARVGTSWIGLALLLVVAGISGLLWFSSAEIKLPDGVTIHDYQQVTQNLRRSGWRTPGRAEVYFSLGKEFAERQKWETAATLFASVPALQSRHGREARFLQAQSVLQLDRLRESEQLFREYLADTPTAGQSRWPFPAGNDDRLQALHYLSYLLSVELRFDERRKLLSELVRQRDADLFDTLACHFQSLMEWNNTHSVARLERACAIAPDDWQLQSVLAQYRVAQGQLDQAWQLLLKCREQMPNDLDIAAACLTCLEERSDLNGYMQLTAQIPPLSEGDPVNLLRHRGQSALRQQHPSEAVTCFQKGLQMDPANVRCRVGLAEAWGALKQPDRRRHELAAAQDLARIQNRLGWAASKTPTPEVLLEIAQLSADAGLQTAAADVCRIAVQLFEKPGRFEALLRKVTAESPIRKSP
jgi:thioredoxin-like negative regulator of GroEL